MRVLILTALAIPTTSEAIVIHTLTHMSNPLIHKWCAQTTNDTSAITVHAFVISKFVLIVPMCEE